MREKKYKNYCIIVLGKVTGVIDEISEVSEFDVNFLEDTNVVIATFSTILTVNGLKDHFDSYNRGYFIFELGIDNYAVNVGRNQIYNILFKKFENGGDLTDDIATKQFLDKMNKSMDGMGLTEILDIEAIEEEKEIDVSTLSPSERKDMVNEIIDKGVENFTKKDKELLTKLTNYDDIK